jgi:FixJ family two-component response regulator
MTSSNQTCESPPASSVVFVIEGDGSLRQPLNTLSHHAPWRIETVASLHALFELTRKPAPCCAVLHVTQPDSDLPLRPWPVDLPVICVIEAADVSLSVRAMKAGALDVLTKPADGRALLCAVELALRCSEEHLRQDAELNRMRERYASLSRREREVMALVASGRMNKRVANDLGISVITVKAHRGRVMRKMRAQSLANLVIMSFLLQLTPSDQFTRSAPERVQVPAEERQARIAVGLQFGDRLRNRTPDA